MARKNAQATQRAGSAGSRARTERILKERGQLNTSAGLEELRKGQDANNARFAGISRDLDLAKIRQLSSIDQNLQAGFIPSGDGYGDLFSAGLNSLISGLGGQKKRYQRLNRKNFDTELGSNFKIPSNLLARY